MPKVRPRHSLDLSLGRYKRKTLFLVADPQISHFVSCDGNRLVVGEAERGHKPPAFQVADLALGRNPNSSVMILKNRIWILPVDLAIAFSSAGFPNHYLPVLNAIQSLKCTDPDATICVGQHGYDGRTR